MSKLYSYLGFIIIGLIGCSQSTSSDPASDSTAEIIFKKIITPNCALSGCHASEVDPSFLEHGLVLKTFADFQKMISKIPKNETAKEEDLELVMPFNSHASLLYQKLRYEPNHHSFKNFGSSMPLGRDLLTQGEVEYVRKWIDAGAPLDGVSVDPLVLENKNPSPTNFQILEPLNTSEGYQLKLDPFEIYPFFEREIFVHKALNNPQPVFINKFQIRMRPGSHHFILYGFRNNTNKPPLNTTRDLRNKDNNTLNLETFGTIANHIFYFGGSESNLTFNFPEGMAVELPSNMTFDMNSHYFNKGAKPYNGEVYINLHTVSESSVKKKLKVLDLQNNNIPIQAKSTVTHTKNFTFNKNSRIVTLFSHTHKLGKKFEILIKGGTRNGEVVYTSTNWEHPKKIDFKDPILIKAGEGLTSRITYENYTSKNVNFGFTSEDEMGIIFGYYYEE
ncbi:MAG: hypothetical protein ACRCVT_11325 [Leadbetterella sp.]